MPLSSLAADYSLADGTPIRALPKVSLHDHLDGAVRPQTLLELGDELGVELPAATAPELADWFVEQSDSGSLVEYLTTFQLTTSVMQTRQGLRRVARDYVNDLVADGVLYGEVRWAPEQHLRRGLSLDEAVEAVQEGLEQGLDDARAAGATIRVGQLLCAMRHQGDGRDIAELALRHRRRGVAGFDIAGPEEGFSPSRLQAAFDLLMEEWMPVTVHAGEADGLESIRSAILDAGALRLGHGVRIADDLEIASEDESGTTVALGPLAQWVKDRRIPLELCPTSNVQTGAFEDWGEDLADHPFDLLYQLGFTVTVNTDNRTQSGTTLTKELSLLADAFDYDLDDLETFQLNAAEAAFLPVEDREELSDMIQDGFDEAAGEGGSR
ncbi:Adenosine deaminase [Pseudoclavibacter triregionum]|nr:Adenosine deaminase [Pseudoclavibacter triregionum]